MINTMLLEQKLNALKIPARIEDVKNNEFYIMLFAAFAPDITFNKIKARLTDLEIFFGSSVELEPQNGLIVIKVKKSNNDIVSANDFFKDIISGSSNCTLPVIVGKDQDGSKIFLDLVKSPHVLIGGATGSGKSVYMHNCITSLLYGAKSALCMIDIKQVEFSIYENISSLCFPIATDARQAKKLLINLCNEMDNRYELLKNSGNRSIEEYNQNGCKMQYITLIIDELADLLIQDKTMEKYITRLCQLGRASGIHLIVATQRPDSNILSGLIRANIPTRICFAVQKATDSRIILDMSGGEKLQGSGDGLYKPIGAKDPIRFKTPYITTDNLKKIIAMFE